MLRVLIAVVAIGAIFWAWDPLGGLRDDCRTVAYPVRCAGAVIGNRCHGDLVEALPRREFLVDPGAQRVRERTEESASSAARCRVTDCRQWECMDEVFVRTARDGDFSEQLRPGLMAVDPRRTLSVVYVPAWKWLPLRARALAALAVARLRRR